MTGELMRRDGASCSTSACLVVTPARSCGVAAHVGIGWPCPLNHEQQIQRMARRKSLSGLLEADPKQWCSTGLASCAASSRRAAHERLRFQCPGFPAAFAIRLVEHGHEVIPLAVALRQSTPWERRVEFTYRW